MSIAHKKHIGHVVVVQLFATCTACDEALRRLFNS